MNILGKKYAVQYVKSNDINGSFGSAKRADALIRINSEISPEQQEETLLHEVMHIVDEELLLGMTEEQIHRMAVGVYSAVYRKVKE